MNRTFARAATLAATLACLPAATANVSGPPSERHGAQQTIGIVITSACVGGTDGSTAIGFHLSIARGHVWDLLHDTGAGTTQGGGGVDVHDVVTGKWSRVPTVSGGENHVRINATRDLPGVTVDLARVNYSGWQSEPVPPSDVNCT